MIGSVLSSLYAKISFVQSTLIGWGMNSRGTVELAIAEITFQNDLLPIEIYSAVVLMTVLTTFVFPFILNFYIKIKPNIME